LRHVVAFPPCAVAERAEFVSRLAIDEQRTSRWDACKEHSEALLAINLPNPSDDSFYKAKAYNFIAYFYHQAGTTADREKAKAYFEKALDLAKTGGHQTLAMDIQANYAQYCFSQGEHQKAYALCNEAANYSIQNKNYFEAETTYNNIGAMYLVNRDFRNAATYFRKSIEIVEKFRNEYTGEQKLNFMQRGISSYTFLVLAYTELKDMAALFEVQNQERGRVLTELLNGTRTNTPITLSEYQSYLKPDEATVIYTSMNPGSVIINVVTSNGAFAINNERLDIFVGLKQKYLDKINAAADKPGYKPVALKDPQAGVQKNTDLSRQLSTDDFDQMMQVTRELLQSDDPGIAQAKVDFLRGYYDLLIKPIAQHLNGIKKIVFMPDGILNFLPFESLMTREGTFMVQNYDVRYVQSPEVKKIIENRKYGVRPKSLLAMGGALYENMNESAERIRGVDKLIELQSRANQNALEGKSQREVYAALGFGKLNYLPGTLNEVKQIEKIFNGHADVYTGNQMTENFLKSMRANGALKNYKIVHLATHGFAIPQIPQLSGVAMCIFPQMQGTEDGYLTAPEISKLGMQADLAVLSACETGLGKIYGGEGVSGLTQSLLVGGANAAIVSLWPVSDEGTMHFMTGLYNLTENQGKGYDEAVNIMKRKFINGEFGEQFKGTGIWAPFVHYGK
jgi:CHAT domain-containing protein